MQPLGIGSDGVHEDLLIFARPETWHVVKSLGVPDPGRSCRLTLRILRPHWGSDYFTRLPAIAKSMNVTPLPNCASQVCHIDLRQLCRAHNDRVGNVRVACLFAMDVYAALSSMVKQSRSIQAPSVGALVKPRNMQCGFLNEISNHSGPSTSLGSNHWPSFAW